MLIFGYHLNVGFIVIRVRLPWKLASRHLIAETMDGYTPTQVLKHVLHETNRLMCEVFSRLFLLFNSWKIFGQESYSNHGNS